MSVREPSAAWFALGIGVTASTLGPVRKKAWAIGGSRVRLINWRTTAYKGASLPRHIRWAPGSPDTLIIESPRRKYRLALRLRRNRG